MILVHPTLPLKAKIKYEGNVHRECIRSGYDLVTLPCLKSHIQNFLAKIVYLFYSTPILYNPEIHIF